VPIEIYADVADTAPDGIGVIAYYRNPNGIYVRGKFDGLRRKKDAVFRSLSDEAQKWLLLSVLKKI
jgi:hypothetical protein